MKAWRYALAGFALGVGLAGGAWLLWRGARRRDTAAALNASQGRQLLEAVMRRVQRSWVDSLSDEEIYRRAAMGLVEELGDPNTQFLTDARVKRLQESTTGTYSGIGMSLGNRDGWPVVTHVRVGTPAERAGLAIGDRLVQVDGKDTHGWSSAEATTAIRGSAGSQVQIVIVRPGSQARVPLSVERGEIHVSAVTREAMLDGNVGYFLVTTFNDSTARDVEKVVDSLAAAGARRFVLDLRGNPGGLLSQGVEVADLFLDKGARIATTRGRQAGTTQEFDDHAPQKWAGRPLIVLVNGNTASAAEIVAGALQDNDRALVVGRQTYGKGSAQVVLKLEDGGALKVTTARWYTPLGRSIERLHVARAADDADPADTLTPTFHTRSGRVLTGGGGIHPDIVAGDSGLSPVERAWVRAVGTRVSAFRQAVSAAATAIVRTRRLSDPLVPVDAAMRDALFAEMRRRGVDVVRPVFDDVHESIDRILGQEIAQVINGVPAAQRRMVHTDPVVARALELLRGVETADALFKRAQQGAKAPATTGIE